MRHIKGWMAVVLLAFAVLASCASKEEKELKKFVEEYNKTLQKAYETANINLIVPYTMQGELKKLFPVFQAMQSANSVMPSKIRKLRIKKVTVNAARDAAVVETYEEWEYWWEDVGTKKITKPKYTEKYPIQYFLLKDGGGWKVDHLELKDKR